MSHRRSASLYNRDELTKDYQEPDNRFPHFCTMDIFCLGLNHTTAPVAIRERVAFSETESESCVRTLLTRLKGRESGALKEALILSTCNRMEIYGVAEDCTRVLPLLTDFLSETKGVTTRELEPYLYTFTGEQAVLHAYRVVSGIDSMVLGETQIAGQTKKAVQHSRKAGGLGLYLNHLFETAFSTAKLVRSHTTIGRNSVSLASAAVRLAERLFGDLSQRRILYIGAGEMIELCAAHFGARNPKEITVANRSLNRGQALAARYKGTAIRLQDLPDVISHYDIIVSCTASALPILGLGMLARAIKERNREPICIIDLAVPRDVEPEVRDLADVFVYTIDDLGNIVQAGKESRTGAVKKAEELVALRLEEFLRWQKTRRAVGSILTLRERAKALGDAEYRLARKALDAGVDPDTVLKRLTRNLTRKFAHDPTVFLKTCADKTATGEANAVADFFRPHRN